ncbi:glycerol-3-phosphate ABC transporter permease [Acetobacter orientalis]|uniref:Glycerol-3-phosphate ABC transporter permease n=1 Tax=Acetobacter orientalis TaxID=146474 RepID=A0A2Z5ZCT8_9PROT|nr:glycerol-3-phosphate ABC transporter permease [Acetobacter orientalis]
MPGLDQNCLVVLKVLMLDRFSGAPHMKGRQLIPWLGE